MGIAKDIALITALGGGSGQPLATPDWNQNDETAADYIKNRPFYSKSNETELVNGTFAFQYAGDSISVSSGITIDLVEGQIYKVTLDDYEECETLCRSYNGCLFIGLESYIGLGAPPDIHDNTVEFCYQVANGNHFFATLYTGDQHNIIIKTGTTQIVKIPEQYIPPLGDYDRKNGDTINGDLIINGMLGVNSMLMMLSDSGDLFSQIVVSDNKTIITTGTPNGHLVGMTMFGYDDNGCATIDAMGEYNAEKLFVIKTYAPTEDTHAANKKYVDDTVAAHVTDKKLILSSSTAGSTKKFEITVDDSGTLKASTLDS